MTNYDTNAKTESIAPRNMPEGRPEVIFTLLVDISDYERKHVNEMEMAVNEFLDRLRANPGLGDPLVQILHFADKTGVRWDAEHLRGMEKRYRLYRVGGNCNLYKAINDAVDFTNWKLILENEGGNRYDEGIVVVFTSGHTDDERRSAEFLEFPIEKADLHVHVYGIPVGDCAYLDEFDRVFKCVEADR